MNRLLLRALVAGVTAAAVAAVGLGGSASAKVLERGSFAESFVDDGEDFCDVEGLTVDFAGTFTGRYQIVTQGAQGLPHFMDHVVVDRVITNPATGQSVREVNRVMSRDLRVTETADDTLTILVLATGNATVYGENGKAIARNPGQVRFELLIDHGGTPTDPSDDEFLEFLGTVKESTGRSDDFCAAVVPALTSRR